MVLWALCYHCEVTYRLAKGVANDCRQWRRGQVTGSRKFAGGKVLVVPSGMFLMAGFWQGVDPVGGHSWASGRGTVWGGLWVRLGVRMMRGHVPFHCS